MARALLFARFFSIRFLSPSDGHGILKEVKLSSGAKEKEAYVTFFIFNFSKFSIHFWNSHFCTTLCQKGISIFFLAGVRHWPRVRSITDCSRPSDALYFMMGALQGEWRGSRNRDGHRSENGPSRSIGNHPLIPIDSPPFVPGFRVCRFEKKNGPEKNFGLLELWR